MKYFLTALLGIILILCLWEGCEKHKPVRIIKPDVIKIKKDSIIYLEKEVIKWKEQKTKIIYTTRFDTLPTIDTVFVELIKCDSIVKIDSLIINKQDSIISDQNSILESKDNEILTTQKEVKKYKRKLIATKLIAGTLLILTILLK